MWAIGMALHEETLVDHRFGRIMNANIANIMCRLTPTCMTSKVIFVEEPDDSNRLGMKGLGEIGIVGGRLERAQHHRGRQWVLHVDRGVIGLSRSTRQGQGVRAFASGRPSRIGHLLPAGDRFQGTDQRYRHVATPRG